MPLCVGEEGAVYSFLIVKWCQRVLKVPLGNQARVAVSLVVFLGNTVGGLLGHSVTDLWCPRGFEELRDETSSLTSPEDSPVH